jgi:excisionase family DNA binding protein
MSNFVSLEDAAKKLGVSVEEIVDMRSRGEIFGYRDGGSWKFKPEEIERVAGELMGDSLDEDPAGSSLLGSALGSDLLSEDGSDAKSDVSLVPEPGEGSDVRLVANQGDDLKLADDDDDDDELKLESSDGTDLMAKTGGDASSDLELMGSDLELAGSSPELSGAGSDEVALGSDLQLASEDPSGVLSGSGLSLDTPGAE